MNLPKQVVADQMRNDAVIAQYVIFPLVMLACIHGWYKLIAWVWGMLHG